jgi:hypothetical protein
VKKCPQGLPIPELLREVTKEFEGPWLRPLIWTAKTALTAQRWISIRAARRSQGR